jgi:hypothetical protein
MPDIKPKPGSFAPYLEYAQRKKQAPRPSVASPITLLAILARQSQQSLPLADLETLSGLDPVGYREALKSLRDAAYITIEGVALAEVVHLTPKGVGGTPCSSGWC